MEVLDSLNCDNSQFLFSLTFVYHRRAREVVGADKNEAIYSYLSPKTALASYK